MVEVYVNIPRVSRKVGLVRRKWVFKRRKMTKLFLFTKDSGLCQKGGESKKIILVRRCSSTFICEISFV